MADVRFVTPRRIQLVVSEPMRMLEERKKRPAFARPAQPRTPTGRRYGYRSGRHRYRLPG
jgi:hypothetical protein